MINTGEIIIGAFLSWYKSGKLSGEQTKFEKTVQEKKAEKLMGYVPMRQYSLFEDNSKGKTD